MIQFIINALQNFPIETVYNSIMTFLIDALWNVVPSSIKFFTVVTVADPAAG